MRAWDSAKLPVLGTESKYRGGK
uniref:Uncharacterized protein n=1 Tax=Anguilla anguilla TaxID=7936 RepID=A0A0E9QSP1_ANGAN